MQQPNGKVLSAVRNSQLRNVVNVLIGSIVCDVFMCVRDQRLCLEGVAWHHKHKKLIVKTILPSIQKVSLCDFSCSAKTSVA